MSSILSRRLSQLIRALAADDSPRQVAAGCTLGMFVGLLPKDNLLVAVLAASLFAVRINTSVGLLAVGIFSVLALPLDGVAHQLGSLILWWPPARPVHIWLYELPFGPWLGLNNTAVVGQLLVGAYLSYPVYRFVARFTDQLQLQASGALTRHRVLRWLRGTNLVARWEANS